MLRIIVVCLACTLVSGCFSMGGGYPISWAAQAKVESDGCPVIDGEYQDAGDMFHEVGDAYAHEPISLLQVLYGWADSSDKRLDLAASSSATDAHSTIGLQLEDNTLRVTGARADGSTSTFELPVSVSCRDSMLRMEADWDATTTVIASMVERASLALGRTTDGSLLVHSTSSGGFFLVYWPIVGVKDERWMRFPAASATPSSVASTL